MALDTRQSDGRNVGEQARRWRLSGHVQGVGYRPFVYRLAQSLGLKGWVRNQMGNVEVLAQGRLGLLDEFQTALVEKAPPLAKPRLLETENVEPAALQQFVIRASEETADARIHVPPDYFTCEDCIDELNNPGDRRYRYPFINCTQCGPRYTLIARLPYDRPNTSMAGFPFCPACRAEYENPMDRRFHAEPIACPTCGPQVRFRLRSEASAAKPANSLERCIQSLREGLVVAVKGVGGYHLMCDARNSKAIDRLRTQKPRPHKPLAVMFPVQGDDGLAAIRQEVRLRPEEADLLRDPVRPIVLAQRDPNASLDKLIAPSLEELGVMLPYSPLHYLVLADFGAPLVATSANISGEPVLTDEEDVERRLDHVAGAFLHHDRPILRPADDPVYRAWGGRTRPLRLGRGCTPMEIDLPVSLPQPVLGVGAHMKNTITLGWEDRAVISPHIGDMEAARSLTVFEQVVDDLQRLYGVQAQAVVCDAHPGYATARWARASGLPLTRVFHHHAHASALAGEYPGNAFRLVFTWDGVGYGEDGTLWGGEALLGRSGQWRRVASMRSFRLPGGMKASREPWRAAIGACWEAETSWRNCPEETSLLRQAWRKQLNSPTTTAVGRLFDAASALVGIVSHASFEGQGPMYLEAACGETGKALRLPLVETGNGLWETDWEPLLGVLQDNELTVSQRSAIFHASLAHALLDQAIRIRDIHDVNHIGLCGGVFQNRVLTERCIALLAEQGFRVDLPSLLPVNDAAISFGQVIEYAAVTGGT